MARAKTILQSDFPYSISARCINKEWFNISMDLAWQIFSDELYMTHRLYDLRIHSFILMSNHYHLLASTPGQNISQCMHHLMTRVSHRLNEEGNRINENFAGRHYKCILHDPSYYLNTYKYNYRNPVRAGICINAEDYPYSTLGALLGKFRLFIPVAYDDTLFASPDETLRWLNTPSTVEQEEAIRWGLKRQYFRSKKSKNDGKPLLRQGEVV